MPERAGLMAENTCPTCGREVEIHTDDCTVLDAFDACSYPDCDERGVSFVVLGWTQYGACADHVSRLHRDIGL